MINKWLTISITPPKLDESIVVRGADTTGLGRSIQVVEFNGE